MNAELLIDSLLNEAVRENEILRHWFDRMRAVSKDFWSPKFEGWALSWDAETLMGRQRGYMKLMKKNRKWERTRRDLDPGTWAWVDMGGVGEVDLADYHLTPKGVAAARRMGT